VLYLDVFCTVITSMSPQKGHWLPSHNPLGHESWSSLDIISVCGNMPFEIPILWPLVMVGPRPRILLMPPLVSKQGRPVAGHMTTYRVWPTYIHVARLQVVFILCCETCSLPQHSLFFEANAISWYRLEQNLIYTQEKSIAFHTPGSVNPTNAWQLVCSFLRPSFTHSG
jgi:hypothetical protein